MYLIDYHIHSNNSFDSKETVSSVCEAAIEKGIKEICFTEHFSVKEGRSSNGFINFKKYIDEINKSKEIFKDKLLIKIGLEICEPHENEKELKIILDNIDLDFILGSIHNFDIDVDIIDYVKENSKEKSYNKYFQDINKLSASPHIDVIAHLDLMKRYAFIRYGNYNFNEYKEIIEDILKNIIKRGKGIEVNTSTLRSVVNETMPSIDVLKMYYDLGGRIITIGSDAHKREDVGAGIVESMEILRTIGFKKIYTFKNRQAITKAI